MINANIRVVFDRKNDTKGDKNKEALLQLEIRIIGGSRRIFISTGKRITKNQFTYKNGNFICRDRIDADKITIYVRSLIRQVSDFALSPKCLKLEDIKNFNKPDLQNDLIIPFIESEMRSRGLRLSTVKQHNVIIHKLNEFGKILTFEDVNYKNIDLFDRFLRNSNMQDVSIHKKHSTLNSYFKEAVRKGLLKENPYITFKVKKGKSKDPVFLTEEELRKVIKKDIQLEKLIRVRDLFLFQCYTGMAYTDMTLFEKSDIKIEGKYEVIRSSRIKTDERFVTLLLPEAKKILQEYDYELPIISNQKYNDYIKVLMTACDIDKNVSSHTARHTFAVYLINKGVPIEAVSVAMGHSNIKMTQHYAKLLAKSTIEAIASKVINKTSNNKSRKRK